MGYQALLFCPDEKTARTVTQVLSELDFTVVPCTEPFAAVKQLMAERFDAVVVDCDNEQNATLLFKSARTAANNQSSLAVAVVEGQVGVAKAFRIGANLVLTKPINVDQAKGTLRVARGLLRKSEAAKPATSAANTKPEPQRLAKPFPIAGVSGIASSIPAHQTAPPATTVAASSEVGHAAESVEPHEAIAAASPRTAAQIPEVKIIPSSLEASSPEAPTPQIHPRAGFSGFAGAGSAPAPAREPNPSVASENSSKVLAISSSPEVEAKKSTEQEEGKTLVSATTASGAKPTRGNKIALIAVAAIILLAAGGYEAWLQWGRANAVTSTPVQVAARPTAPATSAAPVANAAINSSAPNSAASASTAIGKTSANTTTGTRVDNSKDKSGVVDSDKPAPSAVRGNVAATKVASRTIVIKSDVPAENVASVDAPPVSINGIVDSSNHSQLSVLIKGSQAPTPVLQTVSVSQGVSQGLLIKKAQPTYPPNALRMHVEGPVNLLATVSKDGDISAVKIQSGDPQLARAAADAVRQWKYKPYLLNGTPVEIQTQITVNFRLPR